jgi:phosphoglycolate phosphatase
MFKCIVFDFDGTLADSREVFVSVYNQIAAKYNYRQIERGGHDHLRTLPILDRCRYLKVPLYRIPFLAGEFMSLYKDVLGQIKLFEGCDELLSSLHAKDFQVAIISSNTERNISEFLTANHITSIDQIYCSTSLFGKDKLIRRFLKQNNLKPEQVLYVGDEVRDIEACKTTGVPVAWVDWGYDSRATALLSKPDYAVSSPGDILRIALGDL